MDVSPLWMGMTEDVAADEVMRLLGGADDATDLSEKGVSSSVSAAEVSVTSVPSVVQYADGMLYVQAWRVSGDDVTAKSVNNPPGLNGGGLPKPVPQQN